MARILAVYRVLLDGTLGEAEVLERMRIELKAKGFKLEGYEVNPIGFGIVAVIVRVTAPEEDGVTDEISNLLEGIEGVSSIELDMVSRVG
ncbi:MAG: hypothetical protein NZ992_00925 [Candidatus Korarchaeum sp.]|nr:hypothetical protein [Candidatus Korarchaeum sp.]MDW8035403.1 hypothetical protein [Candidatus Korarchaeum sp.]